MSVIKPGFKQIQFPADSPYGSKILELTSLGSPVVAVAIDLLHNSSNKDLSTTYKTVDVYSDGTEFNILKKSDSSALSEEEAKEYVKLLTGSEFVSTEDQNAPAYSYVLLASNILYRFKYISGTGLKAYKAAELGGGSSSVAWGSITGLLSNQVDLMSFIGATLLGYVPYVSATSDVNLNSHALSGITNLSATNVTATSTINGKILNLSKHSPIDHDATVTIVPHWRTMSEDEAGITFSANGGEYKFTAYDEDEENHTATVRFDATSDHMYYFPDEDGTVALETYVQANPASTDYLLTGIKIGSSTYAIPSQSGQGQFIPLSGTANLSGNIVPSVSNGYSYTLGSSNREFNAIFVRNIYGAASEGLDVLVTGGDLSIFGASAINMSASNVNVYASSSVAIRGEYGVDVRAQYDIDITAENGGDVNITADNDVHIIGGSFTFNSAPVATEVYVDNHHTMVNAVSLSDTDIDRILVKGGIVILDDELENLSLTLAPPNEQLTLTMLNSINNSPTSLTPTITNTGLDLTMSNSIDNTTDTGLTQTITKTELSI